MPGSAASRRERRGATPAAPPQVSLALSSPSLLWAAEKASCPSLDTTIILKRPVSLTCRLNFFGSFAHAINRELSSSAMPHTSVLCIPERLPVLIVFNHKETAQACS